MNRILILSVILWVIPFSVFTQISIDNSDMPAEGDTIRTSFSVDFGINYEETGQNFFWDFSELSPVNQNVDTFISVQQTPITYQLIFFNSANLAQKLSEFTQVPGFSVTNYYAYYKNSESDFREVGFGVTFNGIPVPNKYDNPDILYRFPVQYGNVDSSYADFAIDIPGLGYYGGWKKRVNEADGWGTLETPFGTFETIRIRSDISQYDSVYIDSLGFGLPLYREYVEYKWLGKDFGLPLCLVSDDGVVANISYIDSVRTLSTTDEREISDSDLTVFPNPSSDKVIISYDRNDVKYFSIKLLDLNGRVIMSKEGIPRKNTITIDLNQYNVPPGITFMRIKLNGSVINKKLIIR